MTPRTTQIADAVAAVAPGFRRRGNFVRRDGDEVAHAILIERGKYTSRESNPVTLLLVAVPVRACALLGLSVDEELREPMSLPWWRRIGHLMPERRDTWWDLGQEGSDEDKHGLLQIQAAVQDYALPAFMTVKSEPDLFTAIWPRFEEHGSRLSYPLIRWVGALALVLGKDSALAKARDALREFDFDPEEIADDLQRLSNTPT